MHRFVYDYANEIAPDAVDPLHELLHDTGPVPTVPQLMGCKSTKVLLVKLGN